ncbi:ABC transporter ATP-binding protein [Actinoplanes lobatus]|uniref:ABC transporter ATP-binding protein n=1 Tax=Actinoplanes lobatus TaxID=113568 RepID=A0A7W7HL72_9ACTN|nr:ABC transporter ATP-binding protein [Actinoplanes lobatus]MBB4752272.1 branched-chain amino acid transport system ATP-binding protein [Actinoplanes lobatus]GGN94128.1 ABC transporter ATP-binding protein [Actinoplanes lobatus]GIE45743.1 ABC transporter ATP-binding protein [Actinoplanes lobatus]
MTAVSEPAAPTTSPDLTVEGLTVHYGGVCAVRDLSFSVPGGDAVGVIGANGAGKTSTLKALLGLIPRQVRALRLGGADLRGVNARDMVRHGIGYVPEGRHVFAGLPVEKNLLLGAYARTWNTETRKTLTEVYDLFPVLGEMRGRLAGALSGGQQQMLAIGRALMSKPRLLLLDEPSMGLSPKLVEEILAVLLRLRAEGLTLLLVEQNAKLTFEATSHCLVVENGSVAMTGTSERLRHDPRVRRIYLGL